MSLISVDRTKYQKGAAGLNNGDTVATGLDGLTLDQCYVVADVFLGNAEELRAKYANNNPGQQRMHIGNRLRKAVKAETFDFAYFTSFTSELRELNESAVAEQATAKAEAIEAKRAAKEAAKQAKQAEKEAAKAAKEAEKAEKATQKAAADAGDQEAEPAEGKRKGKKVA